MGISKHRLSYFALILITILSLILSPWFVNWHPQNHPFIMDVDQYYSYLHALFIKHDITFGNNVHDYWLTATPTHHFVPKVTYGIAFFYSPFFLLAKLISGNNVTGYEPIFAWIIHYGCIFYILIGLFFTRKILQKYFDEQIVAITLLVFYFGSNLFYYTVSESESVHGILFFLISAFVYCTIKFNETFKSKYFYLISLILGFIVLIRPTEIILVIFPLLFIVKHFKEKTVHLFQLKWELLVGISLFFIPVFVQLLFWKNQSGQWLFFSYGGGERFFWSDPQIVNVLFSFRKGWLIYTPIAFFALMGFIFLFKKNKLLFSPILIYIILNLYIVSSWWDWTFGGSFGMRALIQSYSILMIPFGYFITWVLSRKVIFKTIVSALFAFLTILNLFQSNLYKHRIIHYDGMTKKAYYFTFLKRNYSKDEFIYLNTLFKQPNYELMKVGIRNQ